MKKFLLGFLLGAVLLLPVGVGAWEKAQIAKPIYGIDCGDYYHEKTEYNPQHYGYRCNTVIHVFDDEDNKCYVVKGSNASGISCLKDE